MSDQWTDNPDAASDDAPEVLPDTVTEGSREADSVAEGLDAAVGVDSADDVDTSADDDVDTSADDDVHTSADDDAAETPVASATDEDGDRLDVVDPVQAFKDDLRSKVGDWYVVHSYAGYENRVKANLETRITSLNMEDYIFEIQVPMEEVTEIKGGQRKLVRRVRMPGYVLVRMDLTDESWGAVRHTPGVTGFVGNAHQPVPLSLDEVYSMIKPADLEAQAAAAAGGTGLDLQVDVTRDLLLGGHVASSLGGGPTPGAMTRLPCPSSGERRAVRS